MPEDIAALPTLHLQAGHDRRLAGGHPWAYSNELVLDAAAKALPPGSLVQLTRIDGKPFGIATFNRNTLIAARLLAAPREQVNRDFLAARIRAALALRQRFHSLPYYRLVHAEGDGLPGFVVDRFDDQLVVQCNTAGAERLTETFLDALEAVLAPRTVILRNDSPYRSLEGLALGTTVARGTLDGPLVVEEHGVRHQVAPLDGQKTGWFFDLERPRGLVAALARGGSVLDLCGHTGAFSLAALKAGARHALLVDRSEPALAQARASAAANGLEPGLDSRRGDLFDEAERLIAAGTRFDVVVADPPSFAKSKKDVPAALRAYRKLARQAGHLTAPGGFLFIASCSHNVETEAFAQEVARGVGQNGRAARLVLAGGAGPDHPVHPQLTETGYLKWQVLQLD